VINGNPYPVTSTRTYSYSVPIPSGETLAIAGLEQRTHQVQDDKIPLLGDIPVLGYAFKSKSDQVIHTTLLAFITPEVMTDAAAGDVGAAELPRFRHRVFLGSKDETVGDIRKSLKGLPADIDTLVAVANAENRDRVINRLDLISVELALIDVRLGEFRMESDKITAHLNSEVAADRAHLSAARDRVAGISVDPANSSLVSGP
jgi:hypothetical protein